MWSNCRLPERLEATPFAERLEMLGKRAGAEMLDLTFSNPTRAFEAHRRRMSEHLEGAAGELREVPYAPDPQGLEGAREGVADYYAAHGAEIAPSELVLSASTSEGYAWLAKILADPGDRILVPAPSYPLFEHLLSLEGVEAVPYRFRYDGAWHLDTGDLRRQLEAGDRVAAIFAVSPNNPTGHLLADGELEALDRLAEEHDAAVVVDEVFLDFPVEAEGVPGSVLGRGGSEAGALWFVLSGLSKTAGLPGAKLGWIAVEGPDALREAALARLAFVGDTFLSASTVTQLAAPAILEEIAGYQQQVRRRLATNLSALDEALTGVAALSRYPVEAGWYGIVRMPSYVDEAEFVVELLEEYEVLVQPGFFYELEPEGHVVVSLLTDPDAFAEGCGRLVQALSERV